MFLCWQGDGSKYCSLRSQHHDPHRTDGPWSIRFAELSDWLRWEQAPTVRMGLGPSALLGYQTGYDGSKPPPYG